MITGIVHINVVCSDLEKSKEFYCDLLGGHMVGGRMWQAESEGVGTGLGLGETAEWKAYLIRFSHDKRATVIDLLQWINPPSTGKPYEKLNNVGMPRMALGVDDVDKTYNELKEKGVKFISPPQYVDLVPNMPGQGLIRIVTCFDPDGTAIEFVQNI
ncbi:MAG: VOC family protein [Promethearchaeota archaeon]